MNQIKDFLSSKKKFIFALCFLGLIYQAVFAQYYVHHYDRFEEGQGHAMIKGDSGKYYRNTVDLLKFLNQGDIESWLKPLEKHRHSYFYPRFTSLFYFLSGQKTLLAEYQPSYGVSFSLYLFQILFYLASVAFLYFCFYPHMSQLWLKFWVFFIVFDPSLAETMSAWLSESLFIPLLYIVFAMTIKNIFETKKSGVLKNNFLLSFLFFILFLTRSVAGWLPYLLLFSVWIYKKFLHPRSVITIRPLFVSVVLFLGWNVVFGLANLRWFGVYLSAPTQVYDSPLIYFSSIAKANEDSNIDRRQLNLDSYFVALDRAYKNGDVSEDAYQKKDDPNFRNIFYDQYPLKEVVSVYKEERKMAIEWCLELPWGCTKVFLRNLVRYAFLKYNSLNYFYSTSYKSDDEEFMRNYFSSIFPYRIVYSLFVYGLFLAGLYFLLREKFIMQSGAVGWLLLLMLFYHSFALGWVGSARYNLPNMWIYYFFIAYALMMKFKNGKKI